MAIAYLFLSLWKVLMTGFLLIISKRPFLLSISVFPQIYEKKCVVLENINTPTREGSSLTTPHLPGFSIFSKNGDPPLPFGFSTNTIRTPLPLWKVYFFENRVFKNRKHKYGGCVLLRSVNIYCQWNVQ